MFKTNFSLGECIVLLQNDWLLSQTQPMLTDVAGPPTLSENTALREINHLASAQISNLLAPCDDMVDGTSAGDANATSSQLISRDNQSVMLDSIALGHCLTPLPEAKLIRCVSRGKNQLTNKR